MTGATITVALLVECVAIHTGARLPATPRTVTVTVGRDTPVPASGARIRVAHTQRQVDGKLTGASVIHIFDDKAPKAPYGSGAYCRTGVFVVGDVIALSGGVYRVQDIRPDRVPGGKEDQIEFQQVLPADLPKGVEPRPDSLILYLNSTPYDPSKVMAHHQLHRWRFSAVPVPQDGIRNADPVARVTFTLSAWSFGDPGVEDYSGGQRRATEVDAEVRAGDVLTVGVVGHRVRAVVPPDAARRIVGWLELDPVPVPTAELGRLPRVVRPALRPAPHERDWTDTRLPQPVGRQPGGWSRFNRDGPDRPMAADALITSYHPSRGLERYVRVTTNMPWVQVGTVTPWCGYLYRVTKVGEPKRPPPYAVTLQWVQPHEMPKGIEFTPGSIGVPFCGSDLLSGSAFFHNRFVRFVGYVGRDENPVGRVTVTHEQTRLAAEVRTGDVLVVGQFGHRVRAVVRPEPARGLVGWVELDPEPLAPNERAGLRVVEPSPTP